MGFVNDTSDITDIKTIDAARGIVLRDITPAMPDVVPRYVLEWGEKRVEFSATQSHDLITDDDGVEKFHMKWRVVSVAVPAGFNIPHEKIEAVICDALDAFGEFHDRSRVAKVDVTVTPDAFEKGRA